MGEFSTAIKPAIAVTMLACFWCWESWRPYFGFHGGRLRHACLNLSIALLNTLVLALTFGALAASATHWAAQNQIGLLHNLRIGVAGNWLLALVLLDGWMYIWHRANHALPILWRFHRVHHADRHVDVTTATRFHLGEHLISALLRLGLIPMLGLELGHLIAYESLLIAVTQFHHADIDLGRGDAWLRMVIVTPAMHKVHHSEWRPQTDSNYATVLSLWDRVFGSFRLRTDRAGVVCGLAEFRDPAWQTWRGIWKMPLVRSSAKSQPAGSRRLIRITFF